MNKKNRFCISLILLCCFSFIFGSENVYAAEPKHVMTMVIKCGTTEIQRNIYAVPDENEGYVFLIDNDEINIIKKKSEDKCTFAFKDIDQSIIDESSLETDWSYEESGNVGDIIQDVCEYNLCFSYYFSGEQDVDRYGIVNFTITQVYDEKGLLTYDDLGVKVNVDQLLVNTSKKGFCTGGGNYALIRFSAKSTWNGTELYDNTDVQIRIYNKKGKYVFQKNMKYFGLGIYTEFKWNGKASKKNEAGVKAGKFVKAGTYYVEVSISNKQDDGTVLTDKKRKKLLVSSKAPKGKKGIASMQAVPKMTGDAELDYIAELMIKKAGVKSSMSQEKKVQKIYDWMVMNFNHVHYNPYDNSYKKYYNIKKLKSKMKAYKKECDNKFKKGKLIYSYTDFNEKWNMVRRIGVCDDHAAIFKILCNHVGIDAGLCGGYYLNTSGTKAPHAWSYAVINGTTYYFDVDVELQNRKVLNDHHVWYKKSLEEAKKNHQFIEDESREMLLIYMRAQS